MAPLRTTAPCLLLLTACGPELPAPAGAYTTGSGALVWIDADNAALHLQQDGGDGWSPVEADARSSAFGTWWWVEGSPPDAGFRLTEGRDAGPAIVAEPLALSLSLSPAHGTILAGEALTFQLDGAIPGLPLEARLSLGGAPLSPDCLTGGGDLLDCIDDTSPALALEDAWAQAVTAAPEAPRLDTLRADIALEDVALASMEAEVLLLGRRMMWGDLHAHSGLSHDGCEDNSRDCAAREATPAADFFALARSASLDFVALTDHAELTQYTLGDQSFDIWDVQQATVQQADGLVTMLGYEWTYARPGLSGGHKTVLLEEVESCDSRRISSLADTEDTDHPSGALYHTPNLNAALSNAELWAMLAESAEDCDSAGRALTFSHHTAWTPPEMVDWTDPVNEPDPDFEPVVEIHSEHASSECADLDAEGCDWGVATDRVHYPEGAVQTALAQGYRLGFVGGTDSHDGRPGSTEDGPSCIGRLDDDGQLICHEQDGALTGLLARAGDLDRGALLDHLFARETAATSGPRLPLRVALVTADGAPHLPGAAVAAGDARLHIALDADDLGGLELIEAALLTPDNQTRAWTDTLPAVLDVALDSAETAYLRLRLWDPTEAVEQRVWLSPWFAD